MNVQLYNTLCLFHFLAGLSIICAGIVTGAGMLGDAPLRDNESVITNLLSTITYLPFSSGVKFHTSQ